MAPSGTYNFALPNSDIYRIAFGRCQLRGTAVLQEMMEDARVEANLLATFMSNEIPNLWTLETITQALTEDVATYNVAARVVMILTAYISQGSNPVIDRVLGPVSASDYASYPVKSQAGFPTVFWFNRQLSPTVTLWPVPDDNGPYTLKMQCARMLQDVNTANGETPDMPNRFLEAFVAGLAYRIARIWKPELQEIRKADWEEAWRVCSRQDTENVNMRISPSVQGYFD